MPLKVSAKSRGKKSVASEILELCFCVRYLCLCNQPTLPNSQILSFLISQKKQDGHSHDVRMEALR